MCVLFCLMAPMLTAMMFAPASASGIGALAFSSNNGGEPLDAPTGGDGDFYTRLVETPAFVHGLVHKAGMLPRDRWMPAAFNHTAFLDWLHGAASDDGVAATPAAGVGMGGSGGSMAAAAEGDGAGVGSMSSMGLRHPLANQVVIWVNHPYK